MEREARAVQEEAEAAVRRLAKDADAVRHQRAELIAELRMLGGRVLRVADQAEGRFPAPSERANEGTDAEPEGEATEKLPVVEPEEAVTPAPEEAPLPGAAAGSAPGDSPPQPPAANPPARGDASSADESGAAVDGPGGQARERPSPPGPSGA